MTDSLSTQAEELKPRDERSWAFSSTEIGYTTIRLATSVEANGSQTGIPPHSGRLRNQVSWRLGELARVELDEIDRRCEIAFAGEMSEHLAVADGLCGRAAQGTINREETADFIHQPGGEHRIDAVVNAPVKLFAGPVEHEHGWRIAGARHIELLLLFADRPPRVLEDLERTD